MTERKEDYSRLLDIVIWDRDAAGKYMVSVGAGGDLPARLRAIQAISRRQLMTQTLLGSNSENRLQQ
jgi:hypothetical protein